MLQAVCSEDLTRMALPLKRAEMMGEMKLWNWWEGDRLVSWKRWGDERKVGTGERGLRDSCEVLAGVVDRWMGGWDHVLPAYTRGYDS